MRFRLKDYQEKALLELTSSLRRATRDITDDHSSFWSVVLSAPTGAGKTVIAAAVIETIFDGDGRFAEDPSATVLWVTDSPTLNEQTKRKMLQSSSTLTPGRLITIDSGFDSETFEPRHIFFLNIQKLARTNPLARNSSEGRTYSIWQTIANTIRQNGAHFYVVIDEAHKGMQPDADRATIVSRIINGQRGINPPVPIVWGISATPHRFTQAIGRWEVDRTSRPVTIPIEDVRASGLLKDMIVLDSPADSQHGGDTTLARAAVNQTLEFEKSWAQYTLEQGEPQVLPILVLQVQNTPTESELSELLAAVFGAWEGLSDENVVNTFGEHIALNAGGHTIRYLVPQEIQDDLDVRVVLCKDAISTGWDCPRAEVLVSLRRAEDYTYIAQFIGRMVRTPLAKRIATDQTLNTVHCYLPHFNKVQVKAIAERFRTGDNDEPPFEAVTDPVRLWRNESLPQEVFTCLESLPTYVIPGKPYRTQVARLHSLAALLAGDNVVDGAIAQAREYLLGILDAQKSRLETQGTLQATVRQIKRLRIDRSFALLAANSIDDLPPDSLYELSLDSNNVDDLFRVAKRKLPEGIALAYWDRTINRQVAGESDSSECKAIVAALALHPEVVDAVEAAAEQMVRSWLREHQRSLSALPETRKTAYEPIRREAREAELTDLVIPIAKIVTDFSESYALHVLSTEKGQFPVELKGWERQVIDSELRDTDLLAWYRNPTGGPNALRIPYGEDSEVKPMYPDFILISNTDSGIRPSIVDPHGYHLADALPKLRGLAKYAETHESQFLRIEAVSRPPDGELIALDLKSETVRIAIEHYRGESALDLFREHGGGFR